MNPNRFYQSQLKRGGRFNANEPLKTTLVLFFEVITIYFSFLEVCILNVWMCGVNSSAVRAYEPRLAPCAPLSGRGGLVCSAVKQRPPCEARIHPQSQSIAAETQKRKKPQVSSPFVCLSLQNGS